MKLKGGSIRYLALDTVALDTLALYTLALDTLTELQKSTLKLELLSEGKKGVSRNIYNGITYHGSSIRSRPRESRIFH